MLLWKKQNMQFDKIHEMVGHVPFITKKNAQFLYNHIIEHRLTNILELGIAHGTATCIMAAALEELGGGMITCVDLIDTPEPFNVPPTAEHQLRQAGLSKFAKIERMKTGYTWFLHDEIVRNTENDRCAEIYDLCVIDGPKNWTIDGAAFFFADKLIKQEGWVIFDDYNWTYELAGLRREVTDGITHRELSNDELTTPQIREVFDLLVKQHPDYGNFRVDVEGDWAIAQKITGAKKDYEIVYRTTTKDIFARNVQRVNRYVRKRLGLGKV